jgi:hypothetical protein
MNEVAVYPRLLDFLKRLNQSKIYHELSQHRDDALMITISVPGERWEIEFLRNGEIEVEIFKSDGAMLDESSFDRLFADFGN